MTSSASGKDNHILGGDNMLVKFMFCVAGVYVAVKFTQKVYHKWESRKAAK
jgi:hypothetical protein